MAYHQHIIQKAPITHLYRSASAFDLTESLSTLSPELTHGLLPLERILDLKSLGSTQSIPIHCSHTASNANHIPFHTSNLGTLIFHGCSTPSDTRDVTSI